MHGKFLAGAGRGAPVEPRKIVPPPNRSNASGGAEFSMNRRNSTRLFDSGILQAAGNIDSGWLYTGQFDSIAVIAFNGGAVAWGAMIGGAYAGFDTDAQVPPNSDNGLIFRNLAALAAGVSDDGFSHGPDCPGTAVQVFPTNWERYQVTAATALSRLTIWGLKRHFFAGNSPKSQYERRG